MGLIALVVVLALVIVGGSIAGLIVLNKGLDRNGR